MAERGPQGRFRWKAPKHVGADVEEGQTTSPRPGASQETFGLGWGLAATTVAGFGVISLMFTISQAVTDGSLAYVFGAVGFGLAAVCAGAAFYADQGGERVGSRVLVVVGAILLPVSVVVTIGLDNPYLMR